MSYTYDGEKFLLKLYNDLYNEDNVNHSSLVNDNKYEKVRKYLNRLELCQDDIVNRGKIDLLKNIYYKKYVIKGEDVPLSYIKHLDSVQFDQTGIHLSDEQINNKISTLILNQKKSLETWIDYFVSDVSKFYPTWAKYWAFKGMLTIGSYDKDKGVFNKRSNKTVAPFVELNVDVLSTCLELVTSSLEPSDYELNNLVLNGNFFKLYTTLLMKYKKNSINSSTDGVWIKFDQGDNFMPLYTLLQGKNTGWCTSGMSTCENQIKNGDFYVYCTYDLDGNPSVPRLAIRMDGKEKIGEIRGVGKNQNVEANFENVLEEKLKDFSDTSDYKKRVEDMKYLTRLYEKHINGEDLTIDEVSNINSSKNRISYFGWQVDPRIGDIKNSRNCKEDTIKALNGISSYDGDLILDYLDDISGIILPNEVNGFLDLNGLTDCSSLVLPSKVNGIGLRGVKSCFNLTFPDELSLDLDLSNLVDDRGLNLPRKVNNLYLGSLKTCNNLKLPDTILGSLDLRNLSSFNNLTFPKCILDSLYLDSLVDGEGLVFSDEIGGFLSLSKLKSVKGIKFPSKIGGGISLGSVTCLDDFVFPEEINGNVSLPKVLDCSSVKFPNKISGNFDLRSIKNCDDVVFPSVVGGDLWLNGLSDASNLILPSLIGGHLFITGLNSNSSLNISCSIMGNVYLSSDIEPSNVFIDGNIDGFILYRGSRYSKDEFYNLDKNKRFINKILKR